MGNGIRTGDPRGFNKGRSSKFRESSRVQQTPEEGRRTYRPKRCGNNNKDEDNSPKNLNDKNQQASSQKSSQHIYVYIYIYYYGRAPSLNCGVLKVKEHSNTSAVISHWVQRFDDQKMSRTSLMQAE